MKTLKPILFLLLGTLITFTSCRTEDLEIIDPPIGETLNSSSALASLLNRTALKDGSLDNILDNANCLSVQLPITATVNGTQLTINDEDGYEDIEDIFEDFDDDDDVIVISYPITVIRSDYSTQTVNSDMELAGLAATCNGENEIDDDIECIDFQYPINASVFNANNELATTIVINNDNDMYDFIDDLDEFVAVTINFPITVLLADGTPISIASIQDLQREIENAEDTCDEDDDNDYNDDDCDNCTTNQLETFFADCSEWKVGDFERNDNGLEEQYSNYTFSFAADGTFTATENGTEQTGSWAASGSGNNIDVVINIPGLPDFNGTWNLGEIEEETDEVGIEFFIGDDELSFYSGCGATTGNNSGDNLSDTLTTANSIWTISSHIDEGVDETAEFTGYQFTFETSGAVTALNNGNSTSGTWSSQNNATELLLNFGSIVPLNDLNEDWDVVSISNTQIELQDLDDNGTVIETLVFSIL